MQRPRSAAIAAAYVGSYLLLVVLCHARPVLAPGITPWHPEAGLTLTFLVLMGPRWSLVTGGAVLLGAQLFHATSVSLGAAVFAAAWIAAWYALLAVLVVRFLPQRTIHSIADAAKFTGMSGAVTLIVACGYVGAFVVSGDIAVSDAARGAARYWLADLNGLLMLTPLLLDAQARRAAVRSLRYHRLEFALQFAVIAALLWIILVLPVEDQLRFFYLLFVPTIWIALRWNWVGSLAGVLVIQSVLILAAETDIHTPRFIDLQFLMLTLSLTALLLGVVVAERRRSEAELRERDAALAGAMRFAVAGEFASALAHELNQPITALVSYLNAAQILASTPAEEAERLRDTLGKATREGMRASEVLNRLRNLYVGGRARRERVDIVQLCESVAAGFEERLGQAGARLQMTVAAEVTALEADRTQLEIAVHNLIGNAVDAVSAMTGGAGVIRIQVESDARALTLKVEDSGPGIPQQFRDQLFEPFVTSKNDGMGLGLAISRSIVRLRGGEISAGVSRELGGAIFTVVLPIAAPEGA